MVALEPIVSEKLYTPAAAAKYIPSPSTKRDHVTQRHVHELRRRGLLKMEQIETSADRVFYFVRGKVLLAFLKKHYKLDVPTSG